MQGWLVHNVRLITSIRQPLLSQQSQVRILSMMMTVVVWSRAKDVSGAFDDSHFWEIKHQNGFEGEFGKSFQT